MYQGNAALSLEPWWEKSAANDACVSGVGYLNADPIIQFPGNLQSYNRHSYTQNNSLSFTDPSGLGIFSKLKKAFKKLFRSRIFRIIAAIAVSAFTGFTVSAFFRGLFVPGGLVTGAVAGGFAAGFTGGLILTGGDVNASLKLGAAGALQGFSGSGFGVRVLGNGVAGGTSSKFLGGSFQKGAVLAALTVSASELVTRITKGIKPTFRTARGEPVLKPDPDLLPDGITCGVNIECDVLNSSVPNTGAGILTGQENLFGVTFSNAVESGFTPPGFFSFSENNPILMFLAKVVPGVNSASVFHDKLFGQFERACPIFSSSGQNATLLGGFALRATIPPVFAFDSLALGVPQIRENVQLVTDDN